MEEVRVFSPATVANVGSGFDILGFALNDIGDRLSVRLRSDHQVIIRNHTSFSIPENPYENIISLAISRLLDKVKISQGYELDIEQKIKPGSGLGSSGSSASAGVFAMNHLLGSPFNTLELTEFAMEGEKANSLKGHADNVAASLYGGFILVRSYEPLEIVPLQYPDDLHIAIIYPQIEVKTSEAKKLLKEFIRLDDAVNQWGNVAGLIHGLSVGDLDLVGRSLDDRVAEPVRSLLIPEYHTLKNRALDLGALGFSISGSGPSMFAFCKDEPTARSILHAGRELYHSLSIDVELYYSMINSTGTTVIP